MRPRYAIDTARREIVVYHGDLEKSWWARGRSPGEADMRRIEETLLRATRLERIYRRHDLGQRVVRFRIQAGLFDAAAVAVRMTHGEPDRFLEARLSAG